MDDRHTESAKNVDFPASVGDLISRQAVINILDGADPELVPDLINQLPSVQSDVPDTNVGDMISRQEAKKYKYSRFPYDGPLLPMERGTAIVNGRLADAAIHMFREPPLITFAKQRGQITTVDVKLLQSPVSKTDTNLLIDDYLIERISKAKKKKKSQQPHSL